MRGCAGTHAPCLGWSLAQGLALHALGRYGEAAATLGKLADADPKNQQVKDAVRMAEYMARKQAAKGAAPASS